MESGTTTGLIIIKVKKNKNKKNLSFVILTYMTILGKANDTSYHAECAGIQLVNKGLVHSNFHIVYHPSKFPTNTSLLNWRVLYMFSDVRTSNQDIQNK